MVVRCTKKLLDLLGTPSLVEVSASGDDWYASVLWLDRRKCLLLTHAGTLFLVLAAGIRKRDLQPLGPYLVHLIECALRQEQLPSDALGELDAQSLHVARTASRSVLGHMNDVQCRYHLAAAGGLGAADIDALNNQLRRTLNNRCGTYQAPLDLIRR